MSYCLKESDTHMNMTKTPTDTSTTYNASANEQTKSDAQFHQ